MVAVTAYQLVVGAVAQVKVDACRSVAVSRVESLLVEALVRVECGWSGWVRGSQVEAVVGWWKLMVEGARRRCLEHYKSLSCHGEGG